MRQRAAHHLGLLVNFLGHVVAVVALVDEERSGLQRLARAFDDRVLAVANDRSLTRKLDPIVFIEIGDLGREGRERQGVGAEISPIRAEAHGERRPAPRADEQILLALEEKHQREGALEPLQGAPDRLARRRAPLHLFRDEMRDGFGIRLARENMALPDQLLAQLAEILDDAIVDDGHLVGRVRMRVVLGRPAVSRPARVAETDMALERKGGELFLEIAQLAAGAHAREPAALERRNPGGIIAAILKTAQRFQDVARHRLATQNSNDAAHNALQSLR